MEAAVGGWEGRRRLVWFGTARRQGVGTLPPRCAHGGSRGAEQASGWEAMQREGAEAEGEVDALQTRLMLALRTDGGISAAELERDYPGGLGTAAAAACADAARELPPEWVAPVGAADGGAQGDTLRLSDPEGLLFSNDAIATVFARLEERLEAES